MSDCNSCCHEIHHLTGLCFSNNCDCDCTKMSDLKGETNIDDFEPDEAFDDIEDAIT